MSLGTNDRCWCGSGQKYKKCHRLTDAPVKPGLVGPMRPVPADIERPPYIANGGRPPTRNEKLVKPPNVVAAMRKAGLAAGEVLDAVIAHLETCDWTVELTDVRPPIDALGIKPRKAMPLLYTAVEGRRAGLPLFDSIHLLGRERSLERLRVARARLGSEPGGTAG